jgi:hypothetical protein
MKNLFTFLAAIMLSLMSFAQLQNGNFETWNNISMNNPNGWYNSNKEAIALGLAPNVTQYTPAYLGNYSVKLETYVTLTDNLLGYVSNSPDPFSGKGGVPYTQQPDSLTFFAKLGIQLGDTGLIIVIFKNAGSPIGMSAFKLVGNDPTNWQRLAFKIGTLPMAPDTVIIAAASSNAMTNVGIQDGSFIVLDKLAFNTSAPIPKGGFENWTLSSIDTPLNWDAKSATSFWENNGVSPIQKTTDKYEGQYALRMKTMNNGGAYFFTGINNGNWNNTLMKFTGGFPYSVQMDTLMGWYKYTPKTLDSGQVNIEFRKSGVAFGNYMMWLPAAATWTNFKLPFSLPQVPDTAVITINSSNWPFSISDTGSVLIIDALQFISNPIVGIQPFAAGVNVLIGPNPTKGEFSILYIPKNAGKATYALIDETGKTIISELLGGVKTTVNISGYPKGIYFVRINDGDVVLSKKLILQ